MGKTIVITGGARSGKSGFSENLAKTLGDKILYIATAIPFDGEMKDRVKRHRDSRPNQWDTHEGFKDLHKIVLAHGSAYGGILLDCVTVMLTNMMFDHGEFDENDIRLDVMDEIQHRVNEQLLLLIEAAEKTKVPLILVTNEVGSGIVPETKIGRVFRDLAGRTNQLIAQRASEVYLLVSGIPVKVK